MSSTITSPPYDPSILKAPLTVDQRNNIVAWMILENVSLNLTGSTSLTNGQIKAFNDSDLIAHYTALVGIQKANVVTGSQVSVPGVSSVTDFLSRLANPNTWVRVAEFTVGAILLGVGVHALLGNSPVGNAAGKTLKTMGKVLPEAKAVGKVSGTTHHNPSVTTHRQITRIGANNKVSTSHQYTTTRKV